MVTTNIHSGYKTFIMQWKRVKSFSLTEHEHEERQKNPQKIHKCQMHHISEATVWYIKEENLLPNYLLPTLFSLASLFWTCRRHH